MDRSQCSKKVNKKVKSKLEAKMSSTSSNKLNELLTLGGNDVLSDFTVSSTLNVPVEADEPISNETFDCQLSESDDEGSDIEFQESESLYETSTSFLSSMKALQSIDLQSVDPETRARLQVLLEAADLVKLNSVDGGLIANQKLIKKLTSSVSEALDEAATALIKMREDQNFANETNNHNSLVSCSTNNECDGMVLGSQHQNQQMLKQGCMISRTNEEGESLLSMAASSGYYELCQVLLATNADVEDRGVKGDCTPLMEASRRGFVDIIQLLLHNKACVNAKSAAGNTALHYAASGGHEQAVHILIKAGAKVEVINGNGHSPLMEAASNGHVGVAKLLVENGAFVNTYSSEFKESALTLACYKGHTDMVQYLLNVGADIEHRTDEVHTALMEACIDGFIDVARLLLDRGAKMTLPPEGFETPLTLVACGGHVELGNLLLSRGAKVDERNDEGYTPLMEAAREGHVEIAALFLNHGADINAFTDDSRETAVSLASCGGFLDVVEFLYQEGADMEFGGSTPLMEAAHEGHIDVVKFLLGVGVNVNAVGQMGDTALSCACENGHTEVAEILLKAGSKLEHESENGKTPLMKAARMGHLATVQFLVNQGSSVNKATTNNDQTVLSFACVGGHLKVVEFLLKQGANAAHRLKDGSTMLIEAAKGGHAQIVSHLLDWSMMLHSTDSNKLNKQEQISPNKKTVIIKQQQLQNQKMLKEHHVDNTVQQTAVPKLTNEKQSTKQQVTILKDPAATTSSLMSSLSPPTPPTTTLDEASLAFVNKATLLSDFLSKADFDLLSTCRVSKVKEQLKDVLTSIMKVDLCRLSPEEQDMKQKQIKMALQQLEDASDHLTSENEFSLIEDGEMEDDAVEIDNEEYDENDVEDDEEIIGLKVKKCEQEILKLEKQLDNVSISGNEMPITMKADEEGTPRKLQITQATTKPKIIEEDAKNVEKRSTKLIQSDKLHAGESVRQEGDGCSAGMDSAVHDLSGASSSLSSSSSSSSSASEVEKFEDACFCCCTNEKPEASVDRGESTEGKKRACINKTDQEILTSSNNVSGTSTCNSSSACAAVLSLGSKSSQPAINLKRDREAFSESTACNEATDESPNASLLPLSSSSTSAATMTITTTTATTTNQSIVLNSLAPHNRIIAKGHRKLPQKPKVPTADQASSFTTTNNFATVNLQLTSFDYTSPFTGVQQQQQQQQQQQSQFLHNNNFNMSNSCSKVEMVAQKNFFDMLCYEEDAGVPIFKERNTRIEHEEIPILKHKQIIHHIDPLKMDIVPPVTKSQSKITSGHANLNSLSIHQLQNVKPMQQELIQKAKLWKQQQEQILKNSQHSSQQQQQMGIKKLSSTTSIKNLQENNVAKIVYTKAKQFTLNGGKNDGGKLLSSVKKFPKTSNRISSHKEHRDQNRDVTTSVFPTIEVNAQTEANHDTALTLASAGGYFELVSLLLTRGADVEHRDKKGFTSLVLAAAAGHLQVVNVLLEHGADVETQLEQTKDTALSLACSGGRHEVVEALLRHGADKEHRNASDYTPLCLAASGGHVSVIRLLLLHGAEINSRTSSRLGISPLMLASMNGHTEAVKLLLDMGGDVNAQIETNRNTALTLACFQGRHEVVELLADRKANLEHRAKKGLTPLMEAAAGGFVEVGRVLLDRGADVCAVHASSTRDTALTIAADKGHFKFVELLVSRSAPVDVKTKKGHTPLWLACNGGHLEVVQLLIDYCADPDSCDNRQISCLIAAFKRGHVKVVRWLVRHVTQLPSDQECDRCMAQIGNDKDLLKRCQQCKEIIYNAKEKQAMEANKIANSLLQELAQEQSIVESKKAAALRKRQKRKMKKKKSKNTSAFDANDENAALDEDNQTDLNALEKRSTDSIENKCLTEKASKLKNVQVDQSSKNKKCDVNISMKIDNQTSDRDKKLTNRMNVTLSNDQSETSSSDDSNKLVKNYNQLPKSTSLSVINSNTSIYSLHNSQSNDSSADMNSLNSLTSYALPSKQSFLLSDYSTMLTNISDLDDFRLEKETNASPLHSTKNLSSMLSSPSGVNAAVANEQLLLVLSKEQSDVDYLNAAKNEPNLFSHISSHTAKAFKVGSAGKASGGNGTYKSSKTKEDGWKEVSRKCKKINVPAKCISRLIGRAGCNINAIRESSGAHIDLDKMKNSSDGLITLKGSPEAILLASKLVEAIINDSDTDIEQLISYYKTTLNMKSNVNVKPPVTFSQTIQTTISSSQNSSDVSPAKDVWKMYPNHNGHTKSTNSCGSLLLSSNNKTNKNNNQIQYNTKMVGVSKNNSVLHDKISSNSLSIASFLSTQTITTNSNAAKKENVTSVWKIPLCEVFSESKASNHQQKVVSLKDVQSVAENKYEEVNLTCNTEDKYSSKKIAENSIYNNSYPMESTEKCHLETQKLLNDVSESTLEADAASRSPVTYDDNTISLTSTKNVATTSYSQHSLGGLINSDFSPFNNILSTVTESFLLGKNKEPKKDFASVAASSLVNQGISSSLLSSSSLMSSLSQRASTTDQMNNSALQAKAPGFRPIGFGTTHQQQRKNTFIASVSPMPTTDSNNNSGRRKLLFEDDKEANKTTSFNLYPNQNVNIIGNNESNQQNIGIIGSGPFALNNNLKSSVKPLEINKKSEHNKLNPEAPNFTSIFASKMCASSAHPNSHLFLNNESSRLLYPVKTISHMSTGPTFNPLIGNERMMSSTLPTATNGTFDNSNSCSSNTSVLFGLSNHLWKFGSKDSYMSDADPLQNELTPFPDASTLYNQSYIYPKFYGKEIENDPTGTKIDFQGESFNNINHYGPSLRSFNKPNTMMMGDNNVDYFMPQTAVYPVRHETLDQGINQSYGQMVNPHLNYPIPQTEINRVEGHSSKTFMIATTNEPHVGWQP